MEETVSFCPSFAYYESAKVVPDAEATDARNPLGTSTYSDSEFTFVLGDYGVTADEIFVRDQIFPFFNRDLLICKDLDQSDGKRPTELTLRHLSEKSLVDDIIAKERDPTTLLSSLEFDAGELDSEPEEMYCVWRPKVVKKSPSRSKKSNSTGSSASKQGKFRYFLQRRSNSEGTREDSFVFLTLENGEQKAERQRRVETGKAKTKKKLSSAHEVFYVRNRAWKEGEKRKSYLPYRQDLVGFFLF
ncbi:hypothetical protein Vadar_027111 [Vaccinium darrowii]|uniref:Uncharacterized protein n=1 Tax=Vaccinium darrowii TaxID=229202 RepID=A0ACB7YIH3_9ERIC|nr:hypothetical protein Vadar_027111 [Vaccinium darrowii]